MKRFVKLLGPHLCRPIVYSASLKLALGLCAVLLWNRYIAARSAFVDNHLQQGFFFLMVYFVLWTWLQYLAFDGMRPFKNLRSRDDPDQHRPHTSFRFKDLINTNIDAFEGLDEDEKTVCRLCADAIVAVVFLLAYILLGAV